MNATDIIHSAIHGPLIRFSDHCAAMAEKEQLRANAVKRCDNLLRQLEQMALLCDEQTKEIAALKRGHDVKVLAGRWDGPAKVL